MAARLPSTDVLCAYVEPLIASARVVVVGAATKELLDRLLELGARSVHVFDPDESRAAKASPPRGVQVQWLPEHDFDVRDGAFQLALIPDLALLPDSAATLTRLRRILGSDGALLVCASNPDVTGDGIGYYDLYDRIALQFASVKMIGVVSFSGTTLAELGAEDEEPDVSVDTQLVPEPEPPYAFCALASQNEDTRLAPYAIVQHTESVADDTDRIARIEAEANARIAELEAALADTSERLDDALRVNKRIPELEKSLDEAHLTRARTEDRALMLEERLKEADTGEEIVALEARLKERASAITDLEKEVRRREEIAKELVMALEQKEAGEEVRAKLDTLALELARRHSELEATKWRVAELEQKLAAQPQTGELDVLRQALTQEHEARIQAESGEELAKARAELQKQAVLLEQSREPSR